MEDIKDMDMNMEDEEWSERDMDMMQCPMMTCPMMHWGMMQCPMMQMMSTAGGMPMQQYMGKPWGYMEDYDMKDWYEEDDSDYDSDDKEEYYYKSKKKKGMYHCPPYQKYYKR